MAMERVLSLGSRFPGERYDQFLSDRLIAYLPGPRWLWVAAWALLPVMHYAVFMQVVRIAGATAYTGSSWALVTTPLLRHAVQSYMIVLSLWAARKLTADVWALRPTMLRLFPACEDASPSPFVGLRSPAGPLALTAVVTIIESADSAVVWGLGPAILFAPYQALWILPMMTLFWVYIVFLIGLDRLGRKQVNLGPFPEDLSLGLGPVGATVFTAFLIFCALTVPFLLVSFRNWLDLTIGLAFFAAGVGAFHLSIWRLHRQMAETKRGHVSRTAALYAETYEPLRVQMTPAALQANAALLSAAEALMRRALAIQDWPFDERTITRIAGISTGVVTAVIARSILSAIGL